ncbi:MAG: hypothetical protein K6L81_06985 [Agarilytica sp.]
MKTALIASLVCFLCACASIDELKSTKTYTPKKQREGTINVAPLATGIKNSLIGKTTVIFIPVGNIRAQGDTSANIMKSVSLALTAAGYNNNETASYTSENASYIRAHVESIELGNFLFSTWGTIILQLRLETRDGEVLWERRIRSSVNAINNYERTASVTMNRLVKDLAKKFVSEDFYIATQRVKRHNDFLNDASSQAKAD